jgi:ElaB/YqjD/DUF883 family membrane-anchored ribosome-binding protein
MQFQSARAKVNGEAAVLVTGQKAAAATRCACIANTKTRITMLGVFDHARTMPPNAADITRRIATLEGRLKRIGRRVPVADMDNVGEAVAAALGGIAERFRSSAGSIGEETANLGNEAVKLGSDAWRRVAREVEHRPLVTLAVAVGVGILVGLAGSRRAK